MQLAIRNWQRSRKIDLPLLRRIVRSLLTQHLEVTGSDLGVFLVAAPEMTRLNENFLQHAGSTDVITFDYGETGKRKPTASLHGEIFVCVDEAMTQAKKFRTTWQSEIVRYIVHGSLHLLGHDDANTPARKKMKAVENRVVGQLAKEFDLRRLDKARYTPKFTR